MSSKTLAGLSSYNKLAADSAVQCSASHLYNNTNEFARINPNSFAILSTVEQNNVLASTLAAISASTSTGMCTTSALASIFSHGGIGNIGGLDLSSGQFHISPEPSASLFPSLLTNSIAGNIPFQNNVPQKRLERKGRGGKIEDIIKRIRDKKAPQ